MRQRLRQVRSWSSIAASGTFFKTNPNKNMGTAEPGRGVAGLATAAERGGSFIPPKGVTAGAVCLREVLQTHGSWDLLSNNCRANCIFRIHCCLIVQTSTADVSLSRMPCGFQTCPELTFQITGKNADLPTLNL